jgi:hypothetical protein
LVQIGQVEAFFTDDLSFEELHDEVADTYNNRDDDEHH